MRYGIANRSGRPEAAEVARMLLLARESGITLLDTAQVYGDAESIIGQIGKDLHGWRIVTKTPLIQDGNFGDREASVLSDAIQESRRRLSCSKLYGLLVHHAENLLSLGGHRLWDVLQEFKSQALVSKIGVSVYEPDQLSRILDCYPIDIVQLPLNLYDQRFLRTDLLDRARRSGVEIHARSAFLQGLLLLAPDQLPDQFSTIRAAHIRLYRECEIAGITPLEGCLRFCLNQSNIDHVIVGCETREQLEGVLGAASANGVCLQHPESFALEDDAVIDPRRWPIATRTKNNLDDRTGI
jgi:aryl-alcohol dehydrogenase-like predicted oxidoreductase